MTLDKIKEQFEKYSAAVYQSTQPQSEVKEHTMLLVSHTLERGGAPLVLLELIDYFKAYYNIIFVSIEDGDLRKEYMDKGLDVYIGNSVNYIPMEDELWDSFQLVFLNTIISYTYIPIFQNRKNVQVLWWLHEPEMLIRNTYGRIIHFGLMSSNIKVLSVTNETAACVRKYYNIDTPLLHMGLEDKYCGDVKREDDKIRFFMPAKFQGIKGQDIMAQAILSLPPVYLQKAEFIFAGAKDILEPDYYELISKLAVAIPAVKMLGEVSKEEVYQWYEQVDCVIAPSRADATPTTIVEGMMYRRLCACSQAAGISRYMENGVNGFVFPAEDIDALKETIMYIVDHYEELDDMRTAGRSIYLEHFERGRVEQILTELIEG